MKITLIIGSAVVLAAVQTTVAQDARFSMAVGAMVGAVLGACNGFDRLPGAEVATIARVNKLDLDPIVDALLALRDNER